MTSDRALDRLAEFAGIIPVYRDLSGHERPTADETKRALLAAAGWDVGNDASIIEQAADLDARRKARLLAPDIIVTSGRARTIQIRKPVPWHLVLEGSDDVFAEGGSDDRIKLPAMPSGVHRLVLGDGQRGEHVRLIAAPRAAPSVDAIVGHGAIWGVNAALYGLRSHRNPGLGDYVDLAAATAAFGQKTADFVGINPAHAIGWNRPDVHSPYSPSHRGFLNTAHIALDHVAPASSKASASIPLRVTGTGDRSGELIDYATHAEHHRSTLLALFDTFEATATPKQRTDFEAFCKSEGEGLALFARFETLSSQHGADWRIWPQELQQPHSSVDDSKEARFHSWLQWQAAMQLKAAQDKARSSGMGLGLYLDLAVGARRDGAEAWSEQGSIAQGVSIGAPPDHLSPAGQNWNLAAYAPQKLADNNYQAFRSILARNMRHCGMLRIDHVLGLNRSFWLPDDGTPGGYIRHNFDALLALVRIEAERHQTVVIGEDLGLVPQGLRPALKRSGIYSYSVLQYEKNSDGRFRKPSRLRKQSLACFGTHDTPTLQGYAEGRDIDWWQRLGWTDEKAAADARRVRQRDVAQLNQGPGDLDDNNGLGPLSSAVHATLAASPVSMVCVQFDDIEGRVEAQNLPGTIEEHPNWRRRSPTPVEALLTHRGLDAMRRLMLKHGRGSNPEAIQRRMRDEN